MANLARYARVWLPQTTSWPHASPSSTNQASLSTDGWLFDLRKLDTLPQARRTSTGWVYFGLRAILCSCMRKLCGWSLNKVHVTAAPQDSQRTMALKLVLPFLFPLLFAAKPAQSQGMYQAASSNIFSFMPLAQITRCSSVLCDCGK